MLLKRMRRGTVVAAGIVGLLTAVSMAFFVGSFVADGSHEGTAGSGGKGTLNIPVAVNFPSNELTPEHAVPLTAEVNNTTTKRATFHHVAFAVTTGAAGCQASWFEVKAVGSGSTTAGEVAELQSIVGGAEVAGQSFSYPAGETMPLVRNSEEALTLVLKETGTDQEACEGATIKVAVHLS
jgi:hypothetical protein